MLPINKAIFEIWSVAMSAISSRIRLTVAPESWPETTPLSDLHPQYLAQTLPKEIERRHPDACGIHLARAHQLGQLGAC